MRMQPREEYYWNKLDNTAKVYPCVSGVRATNVFRLSVKLRDPVAPFSLQRALTRTLRQLPAFNVKLHKGLFWYYLDSNFSEPILRLDRSDPCTPIEKWTNRGFLFRVTYYERRINLEVFHALSDGSGAIHFLNTLVLFYLKDLDPVNNELRSVTLDDGSLSRSALEENSFLTAAMDAEDASSGNVHIPIPKKAYRIPGVLLPPKRLRVCELILPARQAAALAKEHGVTLTAYITALLIHCIYEESQRYALGHEPISVCLPVNLRELFSSHTLRNFFATIDVSIDQRQHKYTLDELLTETSRQIKRKAAREVLLEKIKSNVKAEKNVALRAVPLFLKKPVLRAIYRRSEAGNTCTVSNLGRLSLPSPMLPYLERYTVMMSTTRHQTLKMGMISLGDTLSICLTSSIEETDIARALCRFFTEKGLPVRLSSNAEPLFDPAKSSPEGGKGHEGMPPVQRND